MITISHIAEVALNIFYAGRVKVDKKLSIDDFEQLVRIANAGIMRKLYFDMRKEGIEAAYFGFQLDDPKVFDVGDADHRGRRIVKIEDSVMHLPRNLGVFNVAPYIDKGEPVEGTSKIRIMDSGSENLYIGPDFSDVWFAVIKSKRIELHHVPSEIKKVEVEGIFDTAEQKIPLDIAFDILNVVMGQSLKVAGFPVDKTNNADPNVIAYKNRLQEGEGV